MWRFLTLGLVVFLAFLVGCGRVEDERPELSIGGPAFILFYTDN